MSPRQRIQVVALTGDVMAAYLPLSKHPTLTLRQFLTAHPALIVGEPLGDQALDRLLATFSLWEDRSRSTGALYWPLPGPVPAGGAQPPEPPDVPADPDTTPGAEAEAETEAEPAAGGDASEPPPAVVGADHPTTLDPRDVVRIAYREQIETAAEILGSELSVLIRCEKLLVAHLVDEIPRRTALHHEVLDLREDEGTTSGGALAQMGGGRRQQLLTALQERLAGLKKKSILVIPHLDLLAGGSDAALGPEARELTDLLYERSGALLLAFTDPSLDVPEVIANRFAVRQSIEILPQHVRTGRTSRAVSDRTAGDGAIPTVPLGTALVTAEEAARFEGFVAEDFYKHVAGMNALRLRDAMKYATHRHRPRVGEVAPPKFDDLVEALRGFKAGTGTAFEVPKVGWDDIGGYEDVKVELAGAVDILKGAVNVPERLRKELIPKGFIFHGPPGTGKTLFAKWVASRMQGTIRVVSGPEITDMYVGESERKLREVFTEARRNAPAVIVFDEFDSIAASRTGRDDGGSRAGNAMVAQMLTEMDGFRPEVPVLVIGTTNRLDIIDEALLRPSRFKTVHIGLPQLEARYKIARRYAEHYGIPVDDGLLGHIAAATDGLNGDEVRSLFRDARAGELVGPRRTPATPRRLGELLGQLQRLNQEKALAREQPGGGAGRNRPAGAATGTGTGLGGTRRASTDHPLPSPGEDDGLIDLVAVEEATPATTTEDRGA